MVRRMFVRDRVWSSEGKKAYIHLRLPGDKPPIPSSDATTRKIQLISKKNHQVFSVKTFLSLLSPRLYSQHDLPKETQQANQS